VPETLGALVLAGGVSVVVSTTSCGAVEAPDSRLAIMIPVSLVVAAKLTLPLPVTSFVTSIEAHRPDATAPELPVTAAEGDGALP